MKAAIYARISTEQGKQHLANQLLELKRYANRMQWEVHQVYTDEITGASVARPGLDQLMCAAIRHEFDIVLVFDLSRLTRRGPASAFQLIERLRESKVELWSMTEEYFRTSGAAGPLLIAIAAFLAQQEREGMQARVKAGLARAKAEGTALGRRATLIDKERVLELRNQGLSIREIGVELAASKSIVQRTLKGLYAATT